MLSSDVGEDVAVDVVVDETGQHTVAERRRIDPDIRLKLEALIPEDYVPDPQQRMNLYKRLSRAAEPTEIDEIEEEIVDLYGQMPLQVSHLMQVMRIRLAMKEVRIQRLDYNEQDLVFAFVSGLYFSNPCVC